MCDEDTTFTERASSWLKEFEPTPEQIQDAYSKMLTKLSKNPEIANADTDECLELLVKAYGGVGGSVDDLLASVQVAKKNQPQHPSSEAGAGLDLSNLYEVNDGPIVELSAEQKREAFLKLKSHIGGMSTKTQPGSSCTSSVF